LKQIAHVGINVSSCLKLFGHEIIVEVFQPMWSRYLSAATRLWYARNRRTLLVCGK